MSQNLELKKIYNRRINQYKIIKLYVHSGTQENTKKQKERVEMFIFRSRIFSKLHHIGGHEADGNQSGLVHAVHLGLLDLLHLLSSYDELMLLSSNLNITPCFF